MATRRNDLCATRNAVLASASPIDLRRLLTPNKPVARARHDYAEVESTDLAGRLDAFLKRLPCALSAPSPSPDTHRRPSVGIARMAHRGAALDSIGCNTPFL